MLHIGLDRPNEQIELISYGFAAAMFAAFHFEEIKGGKGKRVSEMTIVVLFNSLIVLSMSLEWLVWLSLDRRCCSQPSGALHKHYKSLLITAGRPTQTFRHFTFPWNPQGRHGANFYSDVVARVKPFLPTSYYTSRISSYLLSFPIQKRSQCSTHQ